MQIQQLFIAWSTSETNNIYYVGTVNKRELSALDTESSLAAYTLIKSQGWVDSVKGGVGHNYCMLLLSTNHLVHNIVILVKEKFVE